MLYSQKISHHTRFKKESLSYLNIMVVGPAGSGKTSFVRTFSETLKPNVIQGTLKESQQKAMKGCAQPTEELYTVSMHIEEESRRTSLSLVDTPGLTFHHLTEQLKKLTNYIDAQFARTLAEESKVKRDAKALDTHIHACIYFLNDPHALSLNEMDSFVLKSLSARVNVIPVISKADTLSSVQLETLKAAVKKEIFDVSRIPIYGNLPFEEEEDEAMACDDDGLSRTIQKLEEFAGDDEDARVMLDYLNMLPFSLISYEEEPQTGRPVQLKDSGETTPFLGRKFPWAAVDCCNPVHCDLITLKDMLMTSHREMLRLDTFECFYEKYRTQQLTSHQKKGPKPLSIDTLTLDSLVLDPLETDQEVVSPLLCVSK
ncbi:hypothetical protein G6F56_002152 [Rhizopus delemar]|uniref:Septin-type G domain-containing protein n=1 Tax=Rhizopus stolonifer TaxID=4846 RepID=A0A367KXZ0_RHIST|nr:hypothetical protein G6F56_002152 [Rhizopus delemar]RCI07078.1 hypothetical protein CU098_013632 [Rhizopus stolonifer]